MCDDHSDYHRDYYNPFTKEFDMPDDIPESLGDNPERSLMMNEKYYDPANDSNGAGDVLHDSFLGDVSASNDDLAYDATYDPHDECINEDEAKEIFLAGLQAMRQHIVEELTRIHNPHYPAVAEIEKIWNNRWGEDPGKPDKVLIDYSEIF